MDYLISNQKRGNNFNYVLLDQSIRVFKVDVFVENRTQFEQIGYLLKYVSRLLIVT